MKRLIYLFSFITIPGIVFAQDRLRDGIYLIDQSGNSSTVTLQHNKATVQINPFFYEGDPETYKPLVVYTSEFVPFELAAAPVVQSQPDGESQLLIHLTDSASERLKEFTTKNMMSDITVVVDNQAIAVYKVLQPVAGGFIKIAKCSGTACNQVSRQLKLTSKI